MKNMDPMVRSPKTIRMTATATIQGVSLGKKLTKTKSKEEHCWENEQV
jgi:hypothetical protein